MLKRFSGENLKVPSTLRQTMAALEEKGVNAKFQLREPDKAHLCAEPRFLAYFV